MTIEIKISDGEGDSNLQITNRHTNLGTSLEVYLEKHLISFDIEYEDLESIVDAFRNWAIRQNVE